MPTHARDAALTCANGAATRTIDNQSPCRLPARAMPGCVPLRVHTAAHVGRPMRGAPTHCSRH
eukprot:9732622-Alexandrium_andersonii.AAC.1